MNDNERPFFDDIESYLAGALPPGEQARWDTELAQNPELRAEVDRIHELQRHLRTLNMEERVKKALRNQPVPEPEPAPHFGRRKYVRMLTISILTILLAIPCIWWWSRSHSGVPATPPLPNTQPAQTIPSADSLSPAQKQAPTKPIAQNQPMVPAGSQLRGSSPSDPSELKQLLESVWFTAYDTVSQHYHFGFQPTVNALSQKDYPAAYVSLRMVEKAKPGNDTLAYLKGICLLELGEGAEAGRYFSQLDKTGHPKRAEGLWLSGLGWMLAGEREKAKRAWEKLKSLRAPVYSQKADAALLRIQ